MRKKAEIKAERQDAATERNPKRGPATAKPAAKRAGAPLKAGSTRVGPGGSVKVARDSGTGEFVTKATAKANPKTTTVETVGKKGKAKSRKSKEPMFLLVPVDGLLYERPAGHEAGRGDAIIAADPSQFRTKGEMLSFLAESIIDEDTGEVDESGDVGKFKMPETLAGCADLLYTTRQRRLKHDHASKAIKLQEKALREHLINNLPKSSATGAAGHIARAQIETEDSPVVEDWELVRKFIKRTGEFDLLNKAINRKAVKERWNAGKDVPGVGHFTAVKVSLNKI